MEIKLLHSSVWLLALLAFLNSPYSSLGETRYDYQVIAIMEDEPNIVKAGRFLYQKHATISRVVKWNKGTMSFDLVKWKGNAQFNPADAFEPTTEPLPIGANQDFHWEKTRIQVVGHGDIHGKTAKIAGFTAKDLANAIVNDLHVGNVGRISLVGCTRRTLLGKQPKKQKQPKYLEEFMKRLKVLKKTNTEVSLRSALVSVDPMGRKLTGELVLSYHRQTGNPDPAPPDLQVGIEWSHKKASSKWIGKFKKKNKVIYELVTVSKEAIEKAMPSRFFGILPVNTQVYLTQGETTYKVDETHAFSWINQIAQNTYMNSHEGVQEAEYPVRFLSDSGAEPRNTHIREITSLNGLLKELRYYGDTGPLPSISDRPQAEKMVYYRFGDWVVSMNKENFYVKVEGIIYSEQRREEINTIQNEWPQQGLPVEYPEMKRNTGENFFHDVKAWISGQRSEIGLSRESAYNAQTGMAMFLSESIRNFHSHITNMMCLDLVEHGYLSKEYFFNVHPMARGGTWPGGKTGLEFLRDTSGLSSNEIKRVDGVKSRISRICQTWLSHVGHEGVQGSRDPPPGTDPQVLNNNQLIQMLNDISDVASSIEPTQYIREYELREATSALLASKITEPEIEAVDAQIEEFSATEDISSPLRASLALANDHAYISSLINQEVQLKQQQTGKEYEIIPNSLTFGENDDEVRFRMRDKATRSNELEVSVSIDESKLESKELVDDLHSKATELQEEGHSTLSKVNRALAIYGIVMGLKGSIKALEAGDITHGAIGLAQSIHGVGELTGINRAIYKAAGKYLGQLLRNQVENVGHVVSTIPEEDAGRLLESTGGEVLSTVGRAGELLEDVPIIGTAFGIYNIYEDFQQHSTIGYIDAGLDIAITGLSFLGPEVEPIVVALTIVRMGIDEFYNDISKELKALPPNASAIQKVGAVFKGIEEAIVNLYEEFTLPGQIYAAITNSHKLDEQYHGDRQFLNKLSNYRNYFTVVREEGSGAQQINFAGGEESWNGGDIMFVLGENGGAHLTLEAVDSNGNLVHEEHDLSRYVYPNITDIVMGIGESRRVSFRTETVHFMWFIPVHSRRLISDVTGEPQTLHGTYYGNSKNNRFIAVQNLPQDVGYNVHDYHYQLYGQGGDDSFYLGPQHSYVEGNDGSDTYFINTTSVFTEINNFADDGKTDFMMLNLDYCQLSCGREGMHLRITAGDTHAILVDNWYHDATYQHMVFKSRDGVLFKISITGTAGHCVPYALTATMASRAQVLDARDHKFSTVITLMGSEYEDVLTGNALDNQIEGGLGYDTLSGGEGKDTYTINDNDGIDTIDNYATDGKTDFLFLGAEHSEIDVSKRANDLCITKVRSSSSDLVGHVTGAVIKNWFLNENYQHLLVVSADGVVLKLSTMGCHVISIQPLIVDLSLARSESESQQDQDMPQHTMNLRDDFSLHSVVTVLGSSENDRIVGNHQNNYMSGGRGYDVLEGGEGQDVYVIKSEDGTDVIVNLAQDKQRDTLLFGANFDDIQLSSSYGDLTVSSPQQHMEAVLESWFSGEAYQHLIVRSADGVVFTLPTSQQTLQKTAVVVDKSNSTIGLRLSLTDRWSHVERVIGSQVHDSISGNARENYLDPGPGQCTLRGNNGSDTYVVKATYGTGNLIENDARDDNPDTLLFLVPFISINATKSGDDIQLTSNTSKGYVNARIVDFVSDNSTQHLTIITEDGVTFVLPEFTDYTPVPLIINRVSTNTGQHINLTSSYTYVRTVYGSKDNPNCIIGNDQNNTLIGGSKADILIGSYGNDVLKGGGGSDNLMGGPGYDILVGGDGDDTMDGGEGDDIFSPGDGENRVIGGPGTDTVIYGGDAVQQRGIHINLLEGTCIHGCRGDAEDTIQGVENVYGSNYDDIMQGDEEDNVIVGRGGDDYLAPGSGYDILIGGNGTDTYDLGAANGTVVLQNLAEDQALDKLALWYTRVSDLVYEKAGDDLVIRVINTEVPVFYDGTKPTVLIKDWYKGDYYQHVCIEAADGRIAMAVLEGHARNATAGDE